MLKRAFFLISLMLVLSGCSGGESSSGQGEAPNFSGPYADEFSQIYSRTEDPFVREVVADSEISDQEIAEVRNRYSTCMSNQGLFDIKFDDGDSGVSYGFPPSMGSERANQVSQECEMSTGYGDISLLYSSVRANPEIAPIKQDVAAD